jgi:hypothetical protein
VDLAGGRGGFDRLCTLLGGGENENRTEQPRRKAMTLIKICVYAPHYLRNVEIFSIQEGIVVIKTSYGSDGPGFESQ